MAPESRLPAGVAALLVAFPWINPVSFGPSSAVQPWLASAACALALWALASQGFRRPLVPGALAATAAALSIWAALTHLPLRPEGLMLAAGLAVIVLSAAVARVPGIAVGLQAGLLAAALVNALIGLVQYFGFSEALAPLVNITPRGEAYGNLRQTNQFTTSCWMAAAILLFGTLRLPRAPGFACMALLGFAAAASGSRTGVLEAVTLLVLAAWWPGPRRPERLLLLGAGLAAYALGTALLPALLPAVVEAGTDSAPARVVWERFAADDGCSSRRVVWSNVLQLIARKPVFGWGWGELDYAHYMNLYPGRRFCEILDNAHNLPLHLAVELGVPVALLAIAGAAWWAWRQRPWAEAAPLRQLAWAMLALLLLHSLLEYPLWYGTFQIACGIAIGWLLAPAPVAVPRRLRWPAAATAGALLAGTAYAGWDYARVSQVYLPPEERWPAWRDDTLQSARRSWLFGGQARFAELTLATPSRENAGWMYALGSEVLHYSPEPRVIERVIESAVLTGRDDEALLHLARFRAAFPAEYQAWRSQQRKPAAP